MKKLTVILAVFVFALLTSSCSDMNESYNPISPNISLSKGAGETSPEVGIYNYLEVFSPYKMESWKEVGGRLLIHAPALPPNIKEIYCEIIYEESSEMHYLQSPNFNEELFIDVTLQEKVVDVRLYSYRVNFEISGSGEYPFENLQQFDALALDNWAVNHETVRIYSGAWSQLLEEVFLVCEYEDASPCLVYIGMPASEIFSVTGLETKNLVNISLYGFNNIPYGEAQN